MLGSSSTTSSRASGAAAGDMGLPDTDPPVARADAVVMGSTVGATTALPLDATWELAGSPRSARKGSRGSHGLAAAPVADRVVLGPAEAPAAAQVGADRPDDGGLRGHPGEQVGPALRVHRVRVERRDGVDEQRAL